MSRIPEGFASIQEYLDALHQTNPRALAISLTKHLDNYEDVWEAIDKVFHYGVKKGRKQLAAEVTRRFEDEGLV